MDAHLSTWLHCLTSSPNLEHVRYPNKKEMLSDWLDLPYSYGVADMKSISRSANIKFLGLFAAIASFLISFCRKTYLSVYIRIAEAVEALADTVETVEDEVQPNSAPMMTAIRNAAERDEVALSPLSMDELNLASQRIKGHSIVEVSCKWN